MAESNDDTPASPPAGKGGKLLTILALVNFLAVLGLGGYFFYTQQHASAQQKNTAEKHAAKGEHGAPEAEHGAAKDEHAAQEGEHGEATGEHGEAKGHGEDETASAHGDEQAGKGPLMPLEAMVTNLAEPDSDRYLKVTMQVRITSEAARAEVEANLVPVRNQILLYLSSLTLADTTGADNKREIQKRVKRISNEAMPSSRITQVYFTEFVIQ